MTGRSRRVEHGDRSGHRPADPVCHQHAEDHACHGARRGGQAAARADADRGDAAVRGADAGADGRHRPRELVRPRPAAPAAARDQPCCDRPAHRRPRARGRVQRPDPPRGVRPGARAARRGDGRALARRRQEGHVLAPLPALRAGAVLGGLQRQPAVLRRPGDRAPAGRALLGAGGRPASSSSTTPSSRRSCSGSRAGGPADSRAGPGERRGRAAREALLGDFIYEPEPEQILERLLPVYVETRALPRAARVRGLRAGRAHDGDAQRLEERGRADRPADARR